MTSGLFVRRLGPTGASGTGSIVALHGFTASGEAFADFANVLHRPIIAPDLPGHGESESAIDLARTVDGIAEVLRDSDAPRELIGYSLGGRMALQVALDHPELVDRLVLVSAGSGIEDEMERMVRFDSDTALAGRMETMSVDEFLDEWLTNPIVALPKSIPNTRRLADRAMRSINQPARLAAALRALGQGLQPPMSLRLGEVAAPTLLVSGATDTKYTLAMAHMAPRIRDASHVVIDDCPHNVVAAAPAELATAIRLWEAQLVS